jgi:hypothetical protein
MRSLVVQDIIAVSRREIFLKNPDQLRVAARSR